ncbi:MAG: zinc ribbon domain-containing protein [Candidatus Thiodiazotropha sp.]
MKLNRENIPNLAYDELICHIRSSWEQDKKEEYKGLGQALKDELASREPTVNYTCPKCSHNEYKENQIRSSGGGFSALFDIQTEKYRVITCQRCNYSEFFESNVSISQQVLDWLVGS